MKTFIVILHFGNSQITNKCLESIFKHEREFEEIVVVNNDSSKFKVQSSKFSAKLKIIDNPKNLGYAGGMNIGIKYSLSKGASHVLLLNNDVIFENRIIAKLLSSLNKNKEAGIVGPAIKFVRNNKTIYDLGGRISLLFGKTNHREVQAASILRLLRFFARNDVDQMDYVSGCCMLVKKEVFEKVGFFDEDYFLYYEDVDFCLRARKKGFNTYVVSSAVIFHNLSKTTGSNSPFAIYHQTRSALIFGKKHIKHQFLNKSFIAYQSLIFLIKNPASVASLVLQLNRREK